MAKWTVWARDWLAKCEGAGGNLKGEITWWRIGDWQIVGERRGWQIKGWRNAGEHCITELQPLARDRPSTQCGINLRQTNIYR